MQLSKNGIPVNVSPKKKTIEIRGAMKSLAAQHYTHAKFQLFEYEFEITAIIPVNHPNFRMLQELGAKFEYMEEKIYDQ